VYDTVDTGSLGIKNNLFVPNPGGDADMEPNVDSPWNISTAYIRNAPMQSPWELGLIHRGSKWQTINLKKCSSNESEGEGEGGGNTYSAGDANILNQVKMTSDIETYGKVNVNTNLQEVLTVLFQKIRVGSDIGSTDGPGEITGTNEVGATAAAAFASDVLDNNSTNGGTVFYSRAQILRETNGLINTLCYDSGVDLDRDNDATQEEIIGKFINLTQASGVSNIFYVIVVVQAINDIGTGTSGTVNVKGVDCQTGKYDINGDEILATQKIFVTVVRDPVDYSLKIKRFEYLDNRQYKNLL